MSPSDLPAADSGAICQNPLAYLVGLEGVALLRAFAGDYDQEFIDARLAEIRLLLESPDQLGDVFLVERLTTAEGYDGWSVDYDEPGNALIELDQQVVREMLDGIPVGVALDARMRHRPAFVAIRCGRVTVLLGGAPQLGTPGAPGPWAFALSTPGDDSRVLAWLVDEPLDLPTPPGLEWLTPEELEGYYLLYQPDADGALTRRALPTDGGWMVTQAISGHQIGHELVPTRAGHTRCNAIRAHSRQHCQLVSR